VSAVVLWFRDSLETETVEGNLVDLANNLNIAAANGKQFAIFDGADGDAVLVDTRSIIKAREQRIEDAFVRG
jgi:hypothetical protein